MDEMAAEYMALVEALLATADRLSPLGAGILAALHLDIAADSRTFARLLGVAHALVLREVNIIGAAGGYIRILKRDFRTQRTRYELSPAGKHLIDDVQG